MSVRARIVSALRPLVEGLRRSTENPDPARAALEELALYLKRPRTIRDPIQNDPYLSRWYRDRDRPTMPSGGEPFDEDGNPRVGAVWPDTAWAPYLHKFHRSDADRELHSHPWHWACSLILAGGYVEERRVGEAVAVKTYRPGDVNFLTADDFHRVTLLGKDAWTLFVVGPRAQSWGFWDRETGDVTPWREFLAQKKAEAHHGG